MGGVPTDRRGTLGIPTTGNAGREKEGKRGDFHKIPETNKYLRAMQLLVILIDRPLLDQSNK